MQLTSTEYEPKLLEKWRIEMVSERNIGKLLKEYESLFCEVIKTVNQREHLWSIAKVVLTNVCCGIGCLL